MHQNPQSDEAVVERSRRFIATKKRLRWGLLLNAVIFLGTSAYLTLIGIHKIDNLDFEQVRAGFVFGLGLAILWTTFGIIGALFLGKFLAGFNADFRQQELLVAYYDKLRDLGQLPQSSSFSRNQ